MKWALEYRSCCALSKALNLSVSEQHARKCELQLFEQCSLFSIGDCQMFGIWSNLYVYVVDF